MYNGFSNGQQVIKTVGYKNHNQGLNLEEAHGYREQGQTSLMVTSHSCLEMGSLRMAGITTRPGKLLTARSLSSPLCLSPSPSLSLSLRQHNELKSLANKENVYMFLVTWNKMTWQAIKCGRKSSPQQPVVI